MMEEFDDGEEGDKPSCYPGVKRRLFQSVRGHLLLKTLTLEDIKQEQRDFVRTYFKQQINESNREALVQAWTHLCDTGESRDVLNQLNVSPAAQDALVIYLSNKYQTQLEPGFIAYLRESFLINAIYSSHVARFAGETGLTALLEPCTSISVATAPTPFVQRSFFAENLTEVIKALKERLTSYGELGAALLTEVGVLHKGSKSLSDSWLGSDYKLQQLIKAVMELAEDSHLNEVLLDPESPLATALAATPDNFSADAEILAQINALLESYQKKRKRLDRVCH